MMEVTLEQFGEIYFRYGRAADGWGQDYWDRLLERERTRPMKYRVELPASHAHNRMMIVSDFGANECRLFFMTDESEERLFDFPGKE